MNSNIAMADAGKSGLQLSQGDLTTIQNDIMGKYATNIANAMDFKNKTNMSLDEALTNTGLAVFGKQQEVDNFKNILQDNKYAHLQRLERSQYTHISYQHPLLSHELFPGT